MSHKIKTRLLSVLINLLGKKKNSSDKQREKTSKTIKKKTDF